MPEVGKIRKDFNDNFTSFIFINKVFLKSVKLRDRVIL